MEPTRDMLTRKQAAAYLHIGVQVLMSERNAGNIIGFQIGGLWFFERKDLDEYIDEKRARAREHNAVAQELKKRKRTPLRAVVGIGAPMPDIDPYWTPGKGFGKSK